MLHKALQHDERHPQSVPADQDKSAERSAVECPTTNQALAKSTLTPLSLPTKRGKMNRRKDLALTGANGKAPSVVTATTRPVFNGLHGLDSRKIPRWTRRAQPKIVTPLSFVTCTACARK